MVKRHTLTAVSALMILSACGGGSSDPTSGPNVDANGVATASLTGAELDSIFEDIGDETGEGEADLLSGIDVDDDDLESFELRDLSVAGSATYTGMIAIADIDMSDAFSEEEDIIIVSEEEDFDEDDPTFIVVGRSVMNVTFGDDPEITGGANGFIGASMADAEALEANFDENDEPSIAEVLDVLDTVDVDGSLTYSGGSLITVETENEGDAGSFIDFDVDGSLTLTTAVTGESPDQNVTIEGQGRAVFSETLAGGVVDLGEANGTALGGIMVGVTDD